MVYKNSNSGLSDLWTHDLNQHPLNINANSSAQVCLPIVSYFLNYSFVKKKTKNAFSPP